LSRPGSRFVKQCISWYIWRWMDWIEQCFTSPPTQYRLYGRLFLQVKRLSMVLRLLTGQKTQPTVSSYWRNK